MEENKIQDDEISLIDLFAVLWRYKVMIIVVTLIAMIGVVVYSVISLKLPPEKSFLPNKYTAQAQMLINNDSSSSGGLSSMLNASGLGGLANLAGINVSGGSSSNSSLAGYLVHSNSVLDEVVKNFNLVERYNIEEYVVSSSREVVKGVLSSNFDDETGIFDFMKTTDLMEQEREGLFLKNTDEKATMPKNNTWHSGGEIPMYIYRSGWDKTTDTYLAVKGGRASSPHGHMDAGAFVYEYDGVRWAVDLGEHDEHTLEQAGADMWNLKRDGGRWNIFRFGPESHNTLMINGQRHNVEEVAPITEVFNASRHHGAVVDLTSTFAGMAQSVKRTVELDMNNYLVVTDHIACGSQPTKVEWRMATNAEAEIIAPNTIQLQQDGKTMYLRLRARGEVDAVIWPDHQYKEYEERDANLRRVGFVLNLRANESVDVEVTLSPERGKKSISLPKIKLDMFKKKRK
jgi:hypothetical protein